MYQEFTKLWIAMKTAALTVAAVLLSQIHLVRHITLLLYHLPGKNEQNSQHHKVLREKELIKWGNKQSSSKTHILNIK